jgi:hypothetical protein
MERQIRMFSERKEGKKWVYDHYICTDPATVYSRLAGALIAKKLNKCTYITRIKRVNNYDGTQTITITQDNGYRMVFIVPENM